jgi:hypothetical protein
MSRKVYVVRLRRRPRRATRGQSLVEFAIVSIVLLMLILGIIEMGRLLFVYSVVSNAAQEGVRYGIIRPQDMYSGSERQTRVARGTTIPTILAVPNGNCNIVDKAREKVWLIPKNDLTVRITFDNGNGTPTQVPTSLDDIYGLAVYAGEQSRIGVETTYRYQFIVPFMSIFAPSGIDIKMRSARTIENFEFDVRPCKMDATPAPPPPPPPTRTPVPSNTAQATRTSTITPTQPPPTITRTVTRTATQLPPTITPTQPTVTRTSTPPTPSITPTVTRTSVPPTPSTTPTQPTVTRTPTAGPATATRTNTPVVPTVTVTRTSTPAPPTASRTVTPTPTTNIAVPSPPTTAEPVP